MAEYIYQMINASKQHGNKKILENITLAFLPGAKIGVVGPNGAGKSSVLKIMAGIDELTSGSAKLTDGYSIGILLQDPKLDNSATVIEEITSSLSHITGKLKRFNEISELFNDETQDFDSLMEEMATIQEFLDIHDAWSLDSKIDQAMHALGCPNKNELIKNLSGGQRRRVALCKVLFQAPDLLLLDEPTNHLDAESILWLENHLASYKGAVLAVTHDRYFLDNVAGWILELDRGKAYPYEGNYSTYLETKQKRLEVQGLKDAKLAKKLAKELDWVRSTPKAKQTKSKARLASYEKMLEEKSNQKTLDFSEIVIPSPKRLGDKVLEISHLSKKYGDKVIIDDLSFTLPKNGIVGVIGPNGVGKSTLFKLIAGVEKPDSGNIDIGETVEISYVDQNREGINPEENIWQVVSGGADNIIVGKTEIPSRAYIASFGFKGSDQQILSKFLSGGQKNRLNLALTLKKGGNLLLLDEPTNDLDIETLGSLENALESFPGCAVIITHDRWLLDRIATHILAYEGDDEHPGKFFWFEGNFKDYEKNKMERLGQTVFNTTSKHKKLLRD